MRRIVKLLVAAVAIVLLGLALVPWKLGDPMRRSEIRAEIEGRTGLKTTIEGPITFKLLPRPRVQIADVSLRAADGSIEVDAPTVYGDLDIPSVLRGSFRPISASLAEPTLTVDADSASAPALLLDTRAAGLSSLPFRLALRSAVLRIKSTRPGLDTLVTGLDATAHHGAGEDGGLAVSGTALWHGFSGRFAIRVARPDQIARNKSSPVYAQITSPLGVFSATGDVTGGPDSQFVGRASVSTPSLPRLAAALALDPKPLGIRRAALSGDVFAKTGDLMISALALRLDDIGFEGALGLHSEGGRSAVEGTLATNLLDIDGLAGRKIDEKTLSSLLTMPFDKASRSTDIDVRISAATALIGGASVEDAAFSALFHDRRLELTLDEVHAYGGTIKARALATIGADDTDAQGEIAMTDVDVGALSRSWTGHETITGTMNGKLAVDGRGHTLNEVVRSLSGDGQVTVDHGTFVGVSVSQALRRLTRKLPVAADQSGQVTAFAKASTGLDIVGGMLHLNDGRVSGPGIVLNFGGHSDLPRGKLDILAVAAQTDASGAVVPGGPRLPIQMRGTWGSPLLMLRQGSALSLPALELPGFDDTPTLP